MDITLSRKVLLDLLARALPATDAKSNMPILRNVCLVADFTAQTLTVKATDLMVSFTGTRSATVRKAGAVCVPAALTRAIVSKLPDGDITFTDEKGRVAIKSKGARRADSLISIPGEDWPSSPEPEGEVHTIPAALLADVRRLTGYAQSTDDTRPHLASTLFMLHGDALRAVATDGHRLAMASRTVPGMEARNPRLPSSPLSLLVPSVGLARLSVPEDGDLRVSAKSNEGPLFIADVATGDRWSTKLTDAAFPSYEQVIPPTHTTTITCDRAALLESLGAVGTVALDRTNGVAIEARDGVLRLSTRNPDAGEMTDTLDVTIEGPNPAPWGINGVYFTDVLRALTGERVTVSVSGELDAMTVRCAAEGDRFACVVMPMRI